MLPFSTRLFVLSSVVLLLAGVWISVPMVLAKEESPMLTSMNTMQRGLRQLQRQVRNAEKNAESIELVTGMQIESIRAKAMIPPKAATLEGEARATFLNNYRISMIGMTTTLLQLEQAFVEGQNDKAQELIASLIDQRFKGHQHFKDE